LSDVAVVGAGLIGLSIANELAARGAEVTVFDRDEPARAASWAGAGMLAPFSEATADADLLALCRRSFEAYPGFVADVQERSGVDVRLRFDGTLHAALDDADLGRLRLAAAHARANGGDAMLLDRSAVLAREPFLAKHVAGGLFVANEGQVDNRRLGRALVGAARARGVRFERVAQLALACDARRVRGVRTPQGFAAASTVVNAAGAWAGALDGVPEHARVAVHPVAGEMLAIAVPPTAIHALVWFGHRYLVPRDDARLLVGATVLERGFDARVTAGGVHDLLDAALAVAPALASFAVVETWAGLRPATPDGRPCIGRTALEGYLVASGHYRNGILLAPETARIVAELIVSGSVPATPAPFDPGRAMLREGAAAAAKPAE